MIVLLGLLSFLLATLCYYLKHRYQYWKNLEVNGPEPKPFIGNLGKSVIFQKPLGEVYGDIYKNYDDDELVGIYRGTTPVLLLRSPELIKEVTAKSFTHFHDNDLIIDKNVDPILGRNPFLLKGEEWKTIRGQLTPGFTSGKMKWMCPLLENESIKMVQFLEKTLMSAQNFEARELCVRFTLNNVGSCAFGLDGKCFDEDNSEFRQLSNDFFSPGSWAPFMFSLITLFPNVSKYVPVRLVSKKVEAKLVDIVSGTLKYRKENNITRNDFLQIMTELKDTCTTYEFTDLDITAHAAGFFLDGSETSSLVMSYTLLSLAINKEAQTKLREAVTAAFDENNGTLPYEVLISLPYLEAAINESLRLYPPLMSLQKICTKDFTISTKQHGSLTIEAETPIIIPLYGLHHDPKFFENPDSYKPERFLDENKDALTKYTFMPFGEGPRACLGKRFGLLQIKIGVAYIIRHFELSVSDKTQLPVEFSVANLLASPKGGLWLNFQKTNRLV